MTARDEFAGQPDNPDRDPGPRILSLIREVDRLRADMTELMPGVLTREERIQYGRCLICEWHPPTQGHHPDCTAGDE